MNSIVVTGFDKGNPLGDYQREFSIDFKAVNGLHVIFDLDGTLANIDHRRHLVTNGNSNWDKFHQECIHDTVVNPVKQIFDLLQKHGYQMWIFSGRSRAVEPETMGWLYKYDIYYHHLIMRNEGDYMSDVDLKRKWLNIYFPTEDDRSNILCVFDDRQKVVDMWREEGLVCLQVAKGDF